MKTVEVFTRMNRSTVRDSKAKPPEYEIGLLLTLPRYSV
jgi:hypothetical protein